MRNVEIGSESLKEGSKIEAKPDDDRWLEATRYFRREEFKDAAESLADSQKERITLYVECGFSPTDAARKWGCDAKGYGKALRQIAGKLGADGVRDLFKAECFIAKRKRTDATAAKLEELVRKQGFRCALSGARLTPETAALDHITPVADGGTDDLDNLQWVSKEINTMKGTMSQERFIELCHCVSQHTAALWVPN